MPRADVWLERGLEKRRIDKKLDLLTNSFFRANRRFHIPTGVKSHAQTSRGTFTRAVHWLTQGEILDLSLCTCVGGEQWRRGVSVCLG